MPRGPRLDAPGVVHHVIARGIERCDIFRCNEERRAFLDRLSALVLPSRASLPAWSLMSNHLHLLLRTGTLPLSRLMGRLLGPYARAFNRRHRRVGHLFQNRFTSIVVGDDPYLLEVVRYIHLNPVAARRVPQLCTLVGTQFGIGAPVVMSRSCLPAAVAARAIVSWLAVARLGAIPAQVARALGVSVPTVLRGVSRAPTRASRFAIDLEQIAGEYWTCPGFVDTPTRTKCAMGVCHGKEVETEVFR